jgi:nucleoside-diphosphate-sugar epimerase
MRSDFLGPINIGSEEMVPINELAYLVMDIAGKKLTINHIPGPQGVRGRNSNNDLVRKKLGWEPEHSLRQGLEKTYSWVAEQVENARLATRASRPIG